MSGHYSCGQYNEPFQAKRLRNWQYGINNPGKYSRRRCCPTQFISDCNGHLLPQVKRNSCSSPWGDYRTWIWEEVTKCHCVDRVRNPQDYDRPPCSILVTRERPHHLKEAKGTVTGLAKMLFKPPPSKPEIKVKIKNPGDKSNEGSKASSTCPSKETLEKAINLSDPSSTPPTNVPPANSENPSPSNDNNTNKSEPCGVVFDVDSGEHNANINIEIPISALS